MNKTLILYFSKQGFTKKCAEHLNTEILGSTLEAIKTFQGKLTDYDNIIIGTPTYVGSINKHVKAFIENNRQELLSKPLGIFYCAMNDAELDDVVNRNFDEEIRDHADIIHTGGGYNLGKLNFLERFILKKVAKVTKNESSIQLNNLNEIIEKANG